MAIWNRSEPYMAMRLRPLSPGNACHNLGVACKRKRPPGGALAVRSLYRLVAFIANSGSVRWPPGAEIEPISAAASTRPTLPPRYCTILGEKSYFVSSSFTGVTIRPRLVHTWWNTFMVRLLGDKHVNTSQFAQPRVSAYPFCMPLTNANAPLTWERAYLRRAGSAPSAP